MKKKDHQSSSIDSEEIGHEKPFSFEGVPYLEIVHKIEEDIGVPSRFISNLPEEDDWSFIIQLHGLLEAVVSQYVSEMFQEKWLTEFFEKASLGRKLELLDKANAINDETIQFIRILSEVRNSFVHDVRNTTQTLKGFFEGLPKDKQNRFKDAFCWGYKDPSHVKIQTETDLYDAAQILKLSAVMFWEKYPYPKLSLWFSGILCLININTQIELTRMDMEIESMIRQAGKVLIAFDQNKANDAIE